MSKYIPFIINEYCDICNIRGAYNFMGDYLCEKCLKEEIDSEYEEDYEEEEEDLD